MYHLFIVEDDPWAEAKLLMTHFDKIYENYYNEIYKLYETNRKLVY